MRDADALCAGRGDVGRRSGGGLLQGHNGDPDGQWESLFPHVAVGHDGRFSISYVNSYRYVYMDTLQIPVMPGGHFPDGGVVAIRAASTSAPTPAAGLASSADVG